MSTINNNKNTSEIPSRADIPACDKWDLTSLYKTDEDWEKDLAKINEIADKIVSYKGRIKENTDDMLTVLKLNDQMELISEQTGNYAFLQTASDASDAKFQDMEGRYMMAATEAESKTCFVVTEIQEIEDSELNRRIERPDFADYKVMLKKLAHQKPHILSEKEEKIFAMMTESMQTPHNAFSMLTNVDMDFGSIELDGKEMPLSQSTYSVFMENPDRKIRKEAYEKFYAGFDSHKNTLATLYTGNVQQDVFEAKVRGYKSSLDAALYGDNIPTEVYTNLIETVHKNLPTLHKYYEIRCRALGLDELRHYDVYAPLVDEVKVSTPYNEAVELVRNALSPLGKDYTDILCGGLLGSSGGTGVTRGHDAELSSGRGNWVDKYENKGKRSGAFSSGGYVGYPYILLNYKDDSIRDVFTIAHEGGHSMHSWFSAHNNPFSCYNYTIFEAEVASTFNEELLFQYLLSEAKQKNDEKMVRYLICTHTSDILATLHRQTMFAEYELICHELVENGTPLSIEVLRSEYKKLLELYFGPKMVFENESDLEGLRIPHFYSSFYVYKYATGISASLALSERVLKGGKTELDDYFNFLKSGGSRYPIDSLKVAGVDMSSTKPVQAALDKFADLVSQMDAMF